ncbi:MAG: 1-(5-phosphoribosyl)-5-[(5-phosphoribosylamino)methylideneamino]imidazole-4-carboxamide isomerase [Microbacter sp.]
MIEIIPAIDIIDGQCVRLSQGDYEQKTIYRKNPLDVAKQFEEEGIRRLHLVDLDGARSEHIVNHRVLHDIATQTRLVIDFGGGLKSDQDVRIAFENGASMITGGSIAVKNPELFLSWIDQFGAEKIILGADVKQEKIAVNGWTEHTAIALIPFIQRFLEKGIRNVICTDIEKDGMLSGPSIALYQKVKTAFPNVYLIASGGIGSIADIEALDRAHISAVVVGKAIYEGRIHLKELTKHFI